MSGQHETMAPDRNDRHKEKPLSLRLGPDRQRVKEAAARAGVPVRRWLLDAVREKLDREEAAAAEVGWQPARTEDA